MASMINIVDSHCCSVIKVTVVNNMDIIDTIKTRSTHTRQCLLSPLGHYTLKLG